MKYIIFILFIFMVVACDRHGSGDREIMTTEQRAEDMFRKPASEEQGKIPDKFQPIDHEIKKDEP
ncbi:hypothetical protein ACJVC5_12505 [Peredibacter sp. HCB2-198]|uniref:hypothetical protein n=1 Tax=Peredibacter sp. HCB2-198 TaxID=3383025 RepID=UPI0038B5CE23